MWRRTYSVLYRDIKKEDVWAVWADVNNWPQWHDNLDYCRLEEPFEVGSCFILKPKRAPAAKVMITEIKKEHLFVDCTLFFGAKMYVIHSLKETEEGLLITNEVVVVGMLSWLWVKLVAQKVANSAAKEMDAVVQQARNVRG